MTFTNLLFHGKLVLNRVSKNCTTRTPMKVDCEMQLVLTKTEIPKKRLMLDVWLKQSSFLNDILIHFQNQKLVN